MHTNSALEGIRVLDMGRVLSGPLCAAILGDFGADVIKLEMPGTGDTSRTNRPYGGYFACFNRNKRSITLDIKTGKEQFKRLVKNVDVIIENFRPGVMEKLGLGYDVLKELNPGLIYCAISGFGQNGPYRERACLDPVAQAMAGVMSVTGFPGSRPVRCGASFCDVMAGQNAALGILAALQYREKTGHGQFVDVSLTDVGVVAMSSVIQNYLTDGIVNTRMGNGYVAAAPGGTYQAKDGEFILNAAQDKTFAKLCQSMGREELIDDPRYSTRKARCEHREELDKIINEWSINRTVEEHIQHFLALKMIVAPVYDIKQTVKDPQIAEARDMFPTVHVEGMGEMRIVGQPIKLSETPAQMYKDPPALGADNEAVYHALGYSMEEISDMRNSGII